MKQELKDRSGNRIGEIRDEGSRQVAYDRRGNRLGYFDGRYTFDRNGNRLGEGNMLAALVVNAQR